MIIADIEVRLKLVDDNKTVYTTSEFLLGGECRFNIFGTQKFVASQLRENAENISDCLCDDLASFLYGGAKEEKENK